MDIYQSALALFHAKFGFDKEPMTMTNLCFRQYLIQEEVDELKEAIKNHNAEEIVDALGDILYLTIGTADLLDIDLKEAFMEIQLANMRKERGVKPGREHSGGFDVIKPEGWMAPKHSSNYGILDTLLNKEKENVRKRSELTHSAYKGTGR